MANPTPDLASLIFQPVADAVDWSTVLDGLAVVAIAIGGLIVAVVGLRHLLEFIDPEWAEQQRLNREFEKWKEEMPHRRAEEREHRLMQQFMAEREGAGREQRESRCRCED